MFIDTDLEFSSINGVNSTIYPIIFSFGKNYITKNIFKNRINECHFDNNLNIANINNIEGIESSYSNIYAKNIFENINEDTEIVILWTNGKNLIIREDSFFNDKKLIVISTKENNSINKKNKNLYSIQGISYKTPNLLKLIIEGEI
jgi:hypothetical protein